MTGNYTEILVSFLNKDHHLLICENQSSKKGARVVFRGKNIVFFRQNIFCNPILPLRTHTHAPFDYIWGRMKDTDILFFSELIPH